MKKLLLTFFAALLLLPTIALAATFKSGEEVLIDQQISDDLYTSGGLLSITRDINGDLIAVGGKLEVSGKVTQDLMAGAGDLSVKGEVGDDIRAAGGSVRIDAVIKDDLLAAGGDVSLSESSFVGGDVHLAGGNIMLGGLINGDMKLAGGNIYLNSDVKGNVVLYNVDRITFGPNASIQGALAYRAPEPLDIPVGLASGGVFYEKIETSQVKENLPAVLAGFSIFSLLATLFFGLVFLWLCRYYILHAAETAYDATLKSVGVGFLVLILTPIVGIILLITTIGIPLALVTIALWVIYLYVAKVMAAMLIGFKIVKVNEKSRFGRIFGSFALGALIYTLIGMVPIVGWVVNLVFVLIALGSLTLYDFELFDQLRKKKIV
jgi:hypothetical protein